MSTEENLTDDMEIGGTDDMGGFTMPREGNIDEGTGVLMEFTGEIKECGKNNASLGFELAWCEDNSGKANIYAQTTNSKGLGRIVGIGIASGVFDKIDAARKAKGKGGIRTAEGKIKVKVLKDKKFQAQLRKEIEGCKVLCTITHKPAEPYTDDEGNDKPGYPKADIGKIAPAPKGGAATVTESSDKTAAGDGDEDWND